MNDQWRREVDAVHVTEQEVRQAEGPACSVDTVCLQLALRSPQVEKVVGPLEELIAEFEAMTAFQPAQILNNIPGLRNLVLRPPRRRSDSRQAIDFDRGQSSRTRSVRDPRQPDKTLGLRLTKSYPNRVAVGVIAVEPEPRMRRGPQ
jgi:hypothetical protein